MIKTWSKFNYGFDVDSANQYLDFKEGDETFTAEIPFGNYTLGEGMRAVQDAMNALGENVYLVTLDRVTSKVTISADEEFELPFINGPSTSSSIFSLLGNLNFPSTRRLNHSERSSDVCRFELL